MSNYRGMRNPVLKGIKSKSIKASIEAEFKEKIEVINNCLNIQGADGTWNYDSYMQGMYNGIEFALSVLEERSPNFRSAPKKWKCDKKGLK